MFGRNKRDLGAIVEARATITNVQDTGTTINQNPRVKLSLQVHPENGEPFEVTKKVTVSRIRIPRVGDPIRVKYYENDRENLKVQRRTEEDLAAAATPGAAPTTFATLPDPLEQLKRLNELRQAGALTDEEFEAQKAKLLAQA